MSEESWCNRLDGKFSLKTEDEYEYDDKDDLVSMTTSTKRIRLDRMKPPLHWIRSYIKKEFF